MEQTLIELLDRGTDAAAALSAPGRAPLSHCAPCAAWSTPRSSG